jgi:hypothetical protein
MKKSSRRFVKLGGAVLLGVFIAHNPPVFAGWTGLINGVGTGWASVNVRSSWDFSNRVTTLNNTTYPSASMSPTTGYTTNANLPRGASKSTYSRIRGLAGGIWQAGANSANGDGTDNLELQKRVTIIPVDCAALTFDSLINQSQDEFNNNGNSGTITVNATATGGTALWLRGFEFTGSMNDVPADDPDTVENESIEYLKVHGVVKFETLVLGPFQFGGSNACPLIVPFTLSSSNLESLVFAADGVALSLPLVIDCPPDVVVNCDESFAYPPVQYAGCGDITITYDPPVPVGGVFPARSFPVGVTPVTVTATDTAENTTNCTFNVIVTDTTPPPIPELPVLTGESSVTVPLPTPTTDNCGGAVQATTSDPLFYDTQGTFTVHWSFDDGNGNTNTAEQTVIVDDVTAPAAPTIGPATGECSVAVTVPTATDIVAGTITGATTSPLTFTEQGTYTITWTFDDGNGNTSTADQTVIVDDVTPPVPPSLPVVTGSCSSPVCLTPPTATDNCAGPITATTTDPLVYSSFGTNLVHWTFDDGNGNSSTVEQTVIVAGLTFNGFYSPISGTGGSCAAPLRTSNCGNIIPVKFDVKCGGSRYLAGKPTLSIEKSNSQCTSLTPIGGGNFKLVGNEWHFNWDTSGLARASYKLTATLQDGSQKVVWIRLK